MSRCPICKDKKCSCGKSHNENDVGCSEDSSSEIRDDGCGSSCHCPEKISTRRFSSPNSPLPPDQLDALQHCIETANDLLRTLGSKSNPENTRQIQLHFLRLQGVCVKVKLNCGEMHIEEQSGLLATAGRNFIQLNSVGKHVFILNERLISLSREKDARSKQQEQEFIDADRSTKREMVLNFGNFVSKKPELVNLFFGILLHVQLLKYLGEDIKVKTDDHVIIEGTLFKANEGNIQVENKNGTIDINLNQICFLEVINMK